MKVKNMLKMAVAALLFSGMAASSALAADGTGTATANVVVPLAINEVSPLNWGTFAPDPSSPGTVTVGTTGVPSSTVVSYLTLGDPGIFSVTGDGSRSFITSLSANPHTFTGANPANTMTGNLVFLAPPALTGGVAGVQVGGTLDVGAGQAADVYSGNYTVTVNYN